MQIAGRSFDLLNMGIKGTQYNPRNRNGNLRRKHRARFKAMGAPCGICGGRLGAIHYDEPSDAKHPLSFVIDEIIPVSRYMMGGYESPEACARDWNNLRAAHYICNQKRGNHMPCDDVRAEKKMSIPDGEW